ncbi:MAG: GtrA family protein [Pseudomonadota bacterium]
MSRQFIGFVIAGGIAAAINWLSRFAFSMFLSLDAAVVAAYLVGMTTAYVLNRKFVFEASGRTVSNEYGRFAIINLIAIVQVLVVTLGLSRYVFPAVSFTTFPEAVAHGVGVASPIVTSYLGHRFFTFSPSRRTNHQ